jgi:hypothetical protein
MARAPVFALVLCAASGCVCATPGAPGTGETLVEVDAPISARIVERTGVAVGAIPASPHAPVVIPLVGPSSDLHYEYGDPPRTADFEIQPWATRASSLSVDSTGRRFAVRTLASEPWFRFYVVGDMAIRDPEPSNDAPEWEAVPTFAERASELFIHAVQPRRVLHALRGDAAVRVVTETIDRPFVSLEDRDRADHVWKDAVEALTAADRTRVRRALRDIIAREAPSALALARAATILELEAWSLPRARTRALLSRADVPPVAGAKALYAAREEVWAPDLACHWFANALDGVEEGDRIQEDDLAHAAVVVAARGRRCDALARWIDAFGCGIDCTLETHSCDCDQPEEELADIERELLAQLTDPPLLYIFDLPSAVYAAACHQRSVTDASRRSIERLSYTVVPSAERDYGGDDSIRDAACAARGAESFTYAGDRRYHIDDAARRIELVP